jgi:type IV pilus biogenesis protein CpaD/CtpE
VFKRLLVQVVVVGLALSLVTACSSAGKKDCGILLEAKEILKPETDAGSYNFTESSILRYVSKLQESQLLFQEPNLQRFISEYLSDNEVIFKITISSELENQMAVGALKRVNEKFVKSVDTYCNSL